MKSINAKLLVSGLLVALLAGFVGMVVLRSNRDAAEIARAMIEHGVDPLDQLEAASRAVTELEKQFVEKAGQESSVALEREEGTALLAGLSNIVRSVRGAIGSLPEGDLARELDTLLYSINRLRSAEGEVTHRLVRRELSGIVSDVERAISRIRQDLLTMRDQSLRERRAIDQAVLAGGVSGLLIGLLLITYLSRSISRPIRSAASALRQVGGAAGGRGALPGDMMVDLASAIRFVETVIENKDRSSRLQRNSSAADLRATVERQQKRLRVALDALRKPLCLVDENGRMTDANQEFLRLFPGLRAGTAVSSWSEHPGLAAALLAGAQDEILELDDGSTCRVRCHTNPIDSGIIAVVDEPAGDESTQRELERLTLQDSLTGLPNRDAFYKKLQKALQSGTEPISVFVIDVVAFKNVNATLGLGAGDDLLRQVGERLQDLAGPNGTVARLAGDEFGLILPSVGDAAGPERFGRGVMQDFARRPVGVAGRPLTVRLAVGVVSEIVPGGAMDARTVMRDCELALETAKKRGTDPFCVYAPEIQKEHQRRQDIERDLREALVRGEFELHFQPFVDVTRRCVSGFEALVRWNSPSRGRVTPGVFIPIMEETGLIVPLGQFVLRDACRQAARWPEGLTLSLNLSARQFDVGDIVSDVREVLAETGLDPRRLQLEVTESLFLSDADKVLDILTALRRLGITISMDDFGTGYSSLGYLSRFPFDKIKIDQSFVRDLSRRENMAIVRAVLGLGASMKLSVIAEGVETVEQMRVLESEGCEEMQGYLFSPPRSASDLAKMLVEVREDFRRGRFGEVGLPAASDALMA